MKKGIFLTAALAMALGVGTDVYDVGREDAEKAASELSKMPEATIRAKLKEVLEDVWKHRKEFCLPPCS